MTNQTIPPCPVCGVIPKTPAIKADCNCAVYRGYYESDWKSHCAGVLGAHMMALGVMTVTDALALMTIADAADGCIDSLMTGQNIWDETDIEYNAQIRDAHNVYGQIVRRRAAEVDG